MKYSSTFPNNEDPMSESGVWLANTTAILTRFKTLGGKAIAKALGVVFDDSAALQSGYGNDTEVIGNIFLDDTLDGDATHECELLSRATQTTLITTQYESDYSFNGNVQLIRWYDSGGSTQAFDTATTKLFGTESLGRTFVTGDRIRTRTAGSLLECSVIEANGTVHVLGVYLSTVLTTGKPGIGGFTRTGDGGDASKFCFTDAFLTDEFTQTTQVTDDFNRANESPLSKSGAWATPSGVASLRVVSNVVGNVTADTDSIEYYSLPQPVVDHWAELIDITVVGSHDFGAACCIQTDGSGYITTNYDSTVLYLFTRSAGGSFNQIGTTASNYTVGMDVRVRRFGDRIIVSLDGVDQIDVVDTTYVMGQPGIFGFDGTWRADSFAAGEVAAVFPVSNIVNTSTMTDTITITDQCLPSDIRGRNSSDSFSFSDGSISSSIRNPTQGDVLSLSDETLGTFLRGVTTSDQIDFNDDVRYFLLLKRVLESDVLIIDGFISSLTASQITTLIATSLAVFTDESFLVLVRNLSSSDLISIADSALESTERNLSSSDNFLVNDQGQSQLTLSRLVESDFDFSDSQFNFKLLTRKLESVFLTADLVDWQVNQAVLVDGSKIKLGLIRPSIVLGRQDSIRLRI